MLNKIPFFKKDIDRYIQFKAYKDLHVHICIVIYTKILSYPWMIRRLQKG